MLDSGDVEITVSMGDREMLSVLRVESIEVGAAELGRAPCNPTCGHEDYSQIRFGKSGGSLDKFA